MSREHLEGRVRRSLFLSSPQFVSKVMSLSLHLKPQKINCSIPLVNLAERSHLLQDPSNLATAITSKHAKKEAPKPVRKANAIKSKTHFQQNVFEIHHKLCSREKKKEKFKILFEIFSFLNLSEYFLLGCIYIAIKVFAHKVK